MTSLKLGTRNSALALAQTNWVIERLRAAVPDVPMEVIPITTSGDRGVAGGSANLKAAFTQEIEEALLDNRIDLAIHSLKDMPAVLPKGLTLGAVPVREDPRDVWIGKAGMKFRDLPMGARIATGAVRRQAQLRHLRPDLEGVSIRGNVDTRLRKWEAEGYDGIILALAGLKRLGLEQAVTEILSFDTMLPAVGQGMLAIESREHDTTVDPFLLAIDHQQSHQAALAERAFLKRLGGSCQTPIAAHAHITGDRMMMTGLVIHPSGQPHFKAVNGGSLKNPAMVGDHLARSLLERGADKLL